MAYPNPIKPPTIIGSFQYLRLYTCPNPGNNADNHTALVGLGLNSMSRFSHSSIIESGYVVIIEDNESIINESSSNKKLLSLSSKRNICDYNESFCSPLI